MSVLADSAAAADSLTVIREGEVGEVSRQVSRGGLAVGAQPTAARLNANQRILVAVILIAAIYPLLPPELQARILDDALLAAAIAAVLALIKR